MASINKTIPKTGGEIGFRYSMTKEGCSTTDVDWSGDAIVENPPTTEGNEYFTVVILKDEGTIRVSAPAATTSQEHKITITPKIGGSPCTERSIVITQPGTDPVPGCSCSNITSIEITTVIPQTGATAGTVIGTYEVDQSCDASSITFESDSGISIIGENGQIKLAEAIGENDRSEIKDYTITPKIDNSTSCTEKSVILPQEGKDAKCDCNSITEYQISFLKSTFKDTGNVEEMFASAYTTCGSIEAYAGSSEMLQGGEPRTSRDGYHFYFYCTVTDRINTESERTTAIRFRFIRNGDTEATECSKTHILRQNGCYCRCNPNINGAYFFEEDADGNFTEQSLPSEIHIPWYTFGSTPSENLSRNQHKDVRVAVATTTDYSCSASYTCVGTWLIKVDQSSPNITLYGAGAPSNILNPSSTEKRYYFPFYDPEPTTTGRLRDKPFLDEKRGTYMLNVAADSTNGKNGTICDTHNLTVVVDPVKQIISCENFILYAKYDTLTFFERLPIQLTEDSLNINIESCNKGGSVSPNIYFVTNGYDFYEDVNTTNSHYDKSLCRYYVDSTNTASWLSFDKIKHDSYTRSGTRFGNLKITAQANLEESDRTTTFDIVYDDKAGTVCRKTITITQPVCTWKPSCSELEALSPTDISRTGGTHVELAVLQVRASTSYTVGNITWNADAIPSWINNLSLEYNNNNQKYTLYGECGENPNTGSRSSEIKVTFNVSGGDFGECSKTCPRVITQKGYGACICQDAMVFLDEKTTSFNLTGATNATLATYVINNYYDFPPGCVTVTCTTTNTDVATVRSVENGEIKIDVAEQAKTASATFDIDYYANGVHCGETRHITINVG